MAAAMMTDLGTLCRSPVCHTSTDSRQHPFTLLKAALPLEGGLLGVLF